MKNVNLVSLIDRYNTEDRCRDALEAIRWPGGVACIRCGDARVDAIASRAQWQCRSCDYQFSVTAGTIMHRSHLPLRKWFIAIYPMCESRKGMSAKHMDRYLEELEWRFNNRNNPYIFRDTLARIMHTDPLQYRELVA